MIFHVTLHRLIFNVILNRLHIFLNQLNHEKQVFHFLIEIDVKVYSPKRPVPKIEERNLSEQLESIFPDVDETITKESETCKEKIEDLDKINDKVSNIDDDLKKQKVFEFQFFTGGFNQRFDSFVRNFLLSSENMEFFDFLRWDYCKETLENNDLKIHIETGNIYYKNTDTNESIFEFKKNQQDSSKGEINSELSFDGLYR